MPETVSWPGWAQIARTELKRDDRVMQERSLSGTLSVESGMAMNNVVRDCLWEASGDEESMGCGFNDVGVGNLVWYCEDVESVGRGDERGDGERIAVESCGDMGFK